MRRLFLVLAALLLGPSVRAADKVAPIIRIEPNNLIGPIRAIRLKEGHRYLSFLLRKRSSWLHCREPRSCEVRYLGRLNALSNQ